MALLAATSAGLLAAALATSVPSTSAAAATPSRDSRAAGAERAAPAGPIDWHRCKDPFLRSYHAKCGLLTVPLDPADPTGATIQVGVSRVLHTRSPYRGAIFTNAGGPGGSGLFLAAIGGNVPDGVGLTYDWYGFDPRGIGSSRPEISCDPKVNKADRPDYDPKTPALLRYWLRQAQSYATACANADAGTRAVLAHDTTTDTVADYEVLRQAIGASQITWYGGSYGTYVGEVYATLHPQVFKALVFDGVIDPDTTWYQANLNQDPAFQKTFDKFLAWMGKYPNVYHVGHGFKQVKATYQHELRLLARHPADGRLGPDELRDGLLPAAYVNLAWLDVAKAFSALVNTGNAKPMIAKWRSEDPTGKLADNGFAGYLGTECTDAPWPTDWATWQADNDSINKVAPYFTWANAWFNASCRVWPYASSAPVSVNGAALTAPVLMTEQSLDPATPYPGALSARSKFPTARLVVGVGGTSHAVSLFGVACTDDAIAAVLEDGSVPARRPGAKPDKKCPPLEPPHPNAQNRRQRVHRVHRGTHHLPWRKLLPYLKQAQLF